MKTLALKETHERRVTKKRLVTRRARPTRCGERVRRPTQTLTLAWAPILSSIQIVFTFLHCSQPSFSSIVLNHFVSSTMKFKTGKSLIKFESFGSVSEEIRVPGIWNWITGRVVSEPTQRELIGISTIFTPKKTKLCFRFWWRGRLGICKCLTKKEVEWRKRRIRV